jgi:hypothetical protein
MFFFCILYIISTNNPALTTLSLITFLQRHTTIDYYILIRFSNHLIRIRIIFLWYWLPKYLEIIRLLYLLQKSYKTFIFIENVVWKSKYRAKPENVTNYVQDKFDVRWQKRLSLMELNPSKYTSLYLSLFWRFREKEILVFETLNEKRKRQKTETEIGSDTFAVENNIGLVQNSKFHHFGCIIKENKMKLFVWS